MISQLFVVYQDHVLNTREWLEQLLQILHPQLLLIVHLKDVIKFLVGNVSIVVSVYLFDVLHDAHKLIALLNDVDEFRVVDRHQV